jgi:hypothetical protein
LQELEISQDTTDHTDSINCNSDSEKCAG